MGADTKALKARIKSVDSSLHLTKAMALVASSKIRRAGLEMKKSREYASALQAIVGTFYAAPSPDKPPFVKIGDTVKKGDVIMIIESMKLMNEIQSDYDGVVDSILVSDGQPVEYDQPVMVIK